MQLLAVYLLKLVRVQLVYQYLVYILKPENSLFDSEED